TFIHPGETTHDVVAMASSRGYGLDTDRHQTVLPVTHSLQGHGAGSVFKVFVAAAALEDGMGLDTMVDVPRRVEVTGLGSGGAEGCPPATYCVENASTAYPARMPLREALAQSPNTPFITMLQKIGVPRAVDLAVKLGLRSYAEP
ncbi:penicillin-binding protein, partial [Pseudomonas aeruginosa]